MPRTMALLPLIFTLLLLPMAARADDGDAALMKACPGLVAWAATHPHGGDAAARQDADHRATNPVLRDALAARAAADQKARETVIAAGGKDEAANAGLARVDVENLSWLKDKLAKQGFPTLDAVGKQGVFDAWLLVQHADRDPSFQASVLKTLESRLAAGGVRKADIAMLTDRVLRAQGKPQRYATQFMPVKDGSLVMQPTDDLAHIDERRAAMDLMPLPVYRCVLRVTYAPTPRASD